MKRATLVLAALVLLLGGVRRAEAVPVVGYDLAVTTTYGFGAPGVVVGPYTPSPDTSFFQITNNGSSTFIGTIGEVAMSQFAGVFSYTLPVTLAPGQSSGWFGTSPESSNVGGFNGPFGSPQPGIEIDIVGSILLGAQSEGVNLSVNDKDIHSGVFSTNPFGVNLDNYTLQGGDPIGRDPGDGFEVSQANGHFRFFQAPANATPEPASLTLLGGLGLGLVGYGWRRRKQATA